MLGQNTNFNPVIFSGLLTSLVPRTNYFYRFYATNTSGQAWAPASDQFSTHVLNPEDYGSRLCITFAGYTRSELLSNLPILVNLSTNLPGFSYRQFASSDGADLRFTDAGGTRLIPHEIDEWKTNGTSSVWVKVPQLSSTNDSIWAYWGNPADTNSPPSASDGTVWSPDHHLVWHLKESAFPFADSAKQHPALAGNVPGTTNGIVGRGCLFNGSSQYLNAGAIDLADAFTLSAWAAVDPTASNIRALWANKGGGWNSDGFALFINGYNTSDQKLLLETGKRQRRCHCFNRAKPGHSCPVAPPRGSGGQDRRHNTIVCGRR